MARDFDLLPKQVGGTEVTMQLQSRQLCPAENCRDGNRVDNDLGDISLMLLVTIIRLKGLSKRLLTTYLLEHCGA